MLSAVFRGEEDNLDASSNLQTTPGRMSCLMFIISSVSIIWSMRSRIFDSTFLVGRVRVGVVGNLLTIPCGIASHAWHRDSDANEEEGIMNKCR